MALAARGAKVVVNDLGCDVPGEGSDPERGKAVVGRIEAAGGAAVAHFGDIGAPGIADEAVALALTEFGRVDIVFSNAAIEKLADFHAFTRQEVQAHLNVDLFGAWSLCRAAWPHFAEQNYGRIIFSASSAVLGGSKGVPYAMAKGGLVAFSRSLGGIARASKLDIKSNVIAPYAHTQMWTHPQYGTGPELDAIREETRRLLPPEGVATTVVVLAHEACPASGEIFACANGKVHRIYFAMTPGVEKRDLTPEYLLENWQRLEGAEGSREILGTSHDLALPFMERAKAVVSGAA
jgi:NAD(P)-dependent dehydrogenase (short-subunit alcohol dehydrogenase family)